jgi:hypothetical protein
VTDAPDPRSGVDEEGEWAPAFAGQRPPFEPGNPSKMTHGARAPGRLKPIAEGYLERLRAIAPTRREREDELAFERLAWLLARIHVTEEWLDERGVLDERGEARPVLAQLSTWENSARRMMVELGMTWRSRTQLRFVQTSADFIAAQEVQNALVLVIGAGPELAAELVAAGFKGEALVRAFRARYPSMVQELIAARAPTALPPAGES